MSIDAHVDAGSGGHVVQFYKRDEDLVATAGHHLTEACRSGATVFVVATAEHQRAFAAVMADGGVDIEAARGAGALVELDAAATLAEIVAGGGMSRDAFDATVGADVRKLAAAGRPICAYGEMVALLWAEGFAGEALELEDMWNELRRSVAFDLLCAYPSAIVADDDRVADICDAHASVAAGEAGQRFACGAESARRARRYAIDLLRQWGVVTQYDEVAVVVSELATNAVLHAKSPFVVRLSIHDDVVHVSVRDWSPCQPVVAHDDTARASGRGLPLIGALARRWGCDSLADGKAVWAEFCVQ